MAELLGQEGDTCGQCSVHPDFYLSELACERCGCFLCLRCLIDVGLEENCADCGGAPKFSPAAKFAARGKRKVGVVVFVFGALLLFFLLISWPAAIASSAALSGTSNFTILHSMYGGLALVAILACLLAGRLFRSSSLEIYRDEVQMIQVMRLKSALRPLGLDAARLAGSIGSGSPAVEAQRRILLTALEHWRARASTLDARGARVLSFLIRLEAEARRGLRLGSTLD
jgi:hypothetical protein